MLRDEYFRRLVDGAHLEIYLSAIDGARLYWPWRMQPPKDASDNYRNACERYIIDSDPLDDDVTTRDVLDCAVSVGAEVASLQDVYQDKDATVNSLLDGLAIADGHAFDGQLLLPLQKPYVQCWQELGEPTDHLLGIGGLKDGRPSERLQAARELRREVGESVWIHGFGWGVNGIAEAVRDNPALLDSIDYSTPMQDATMSGSAGEERMSVVAMEAAAQLIRDLREVSAYPDHKSLTQATL